MGIPRFPGLMYATDSSQEKGNMGAPIAFVSVEYGSSHIEKGNMGSPTLPSCL